jgi:hypothetical protein
LRADFIELWVDRMAGAEINCRSELTRFEKYLQIPSMALRLIEAPTEPIAVRRFRLLVQLR